MLWQPITQGKGCKSLTDRKRLKNCLSWATPDLWNILYTCVNDTPVKIKQFEWRLEYLYSHQNISLLKSMFWKTNNLEPTTKIWREGKTKNFKYIYREAWDVYFRKGNCNCAVNYVK